MHEEVSETVSHIEDIGKSQYQEYVKEILDDRSKLRYYYNKQIGIV